ncbi:MAG: TerC family protein [Actinobacteria bacterium]|nr:TerC family protein [Actinomycetota bacterium]
MPVTPLAWTLTIVVLLAVLAVDVFVIGRRPHEPTMRESALAIGLYVGAALLFGLGVSFLMSPQYGGQFFAGWLTEYSLSVDNLFIFLIIMNRLNVPRHLQQYALLVGIMLALAFRGVFIALGAGLIHLFSGVFFLFGAFLIYTSIHLAKDYFEKDTEEEAVDNFATRWARRQLPFTQEFHGTKLRVYENGVRAWTPLFTVIVALGTADLLFALDSIPAIYGLTNEPYLVLTANIFALMGLRQLYFLLGNLLRKLVYLSLGLSVILAFIGVKLVLHAMHEYHLDARLGFNGEIPLTVSLGVILGTLIVTTVASLVASRKRVPSYD